MGKLIKFPNKIVRAEFFRELEDLIKERLKPSISPDDIDITYSKRNWIDLNYTKYPAAFYQLQFSTDSAVQHTKIFGVGEHEIVAFYYSGNPPRKRSDWLKAIKSNICPISTQLRKKVFNDYWGENKGYVVIGILLDDDNFGFDVFLYADAIVEFINATYEPIAEAFKKIGK